MTAAEPGKLAGLPTANLKKLGESDISGSEMTATETSSILNEPQEYTNPLKLAGN